MGPLFDKSISCQLFDSLGHVYVNFPGRVIVFLTVIFSDNCLELNESSDYLLEVKKKSLIEAIVGTVSLEGI